jgi:hypothetical protein
MHCCHTAITLLSHCHYTVLTLFLHSFYTLVTLLLHSCAIVLSLLLHCCYNPHLICIVHIPVRGHFQHALVHEHHDGLGTVCVCVCVCVYISVLCVFNVHTRGSMVLNGVQRGEMGLNEIKRGSNGFKPPSPSDKGVFFQQLRGRWSFEVVLWCGRVTVMVLESNGYGVGE